jgi:hypothetical protein
MAGHGIGALTPARHGNSGVKVEKLRNFNRSGSVSQIEFPKFPTRRS